MRKFFFELSLAVFLFAFPVAVVQSAENSPELAKDNTQLAFDMYSQLSSVDGNFIFSPFSIASALTMTYEGAAGATAAEMRNVLHIPENKTELHAQWDRTAQILAKTNAGKVNELNVANALWVEKEYALNKDFAKTVVDVYAGALYSQDFSGDFEASRLFINDWVSVKTKAHIKDLLPPDSIDELTRLVITNAIYFKGKWSESFEKNGTKKDLFWRSAGKTVQADLMSSGQKNFSYFENDLMQMVRLNYEGDELSMLVILPKDNDIKTLEKTINASVLKQWQDDLVSEKVSVFLPKFKFGFATELGDVLASLGMKSAFDASKADFSGITEKEDLYIGGVFHKAWIDVNEEGTEAAAATAVTMALRSIKMDLEPKVFRADHPFLFFIQERMSGQILFMGRISDPTKE